MRIVVVGVLLGCLASSLTGLKGVTPVRAAPVASAQPLATGLNQGLKYYRNGQYEQAQDLFQQTIQQAQKSSETTLQGVSWLYLSLTEQQLQNWDMAEQAIEQGMALLRRDPSSSAGYQALAFNIQGRLRYGLGQTEQALQDWEQAETLYHASQDSMGILGSQINQAQALSLLGFHHRACKLLFRAIALEGNCNVVDSDQLENMLQTFQSQTNPQVRSLGLLTLANFFRLAGNYDASNRLLRYLEQRAGSELDSRLLFKSLGQLNQALYTQQYKLFQQTTSLQLQTSYLREAQIYATQSLQYFRDAKQQSTAPISRLQAQLLEFKFLVALEQDLDGKILPSSGLQADIHALPSLKQALIDSGLDQWPASQAVIQSQLFLAEQLLIDPTPSDRQQALHFATTAYQSAQTVQDPKSQAQALGIFGKIYEQTQQWELSLKFTQRALALSANQRDYLQLAQWQWQLGRVYRQQSDRERALQSYQKAVDAIDTLRQNIRASQNEVALSFRNHVEPIYRQYVDLLLSSADPVQLEQAKLRQSLQVITNFQVAELEDFLNCNLQLRAKPVPDQQTAFIYPILLRDRIEVIVQLPNQANLQRYTTVISDQVRDQTLIDLRRELEQIYPSPEGLRLSQDVYDWLLRPAETVLKNNQIQNLVFILDGSLRNIPIATLHDGQQYLLETGYRVTLLPSLELFESKQTTANPMNALTFGLAQGNPPLPNVSQELFNIDRILNTEQYLDQSFTRKTLTNQLLASSSSIVHLATHGQFSSDPEENYLLAWDQKISGNELSQLLLNRANSPDLAPIELLVLSACKTAKGDPFATLGLAGIAVQSGARSTLSSLWAVNDRSTAMLMTTFYQELTTAPTISKAEALRRAQLKLMKTPGYDSPRFWGAYVLVGNWK